MNAVQTPVGFNSTPSRDISMGELTYAGLEMVRSNLQRSRETALSDAALKLAAGMSKTEESAPSEKELARKALVLKMAKDGDPDRLFKQLCAGVATRSPSGQPYLRASTARWLAQEITNQVTRLAGNAIIERMRESGITAGVEFEQDDAGMFIGREATNTDDLLLARGGQQTTDNLFLQQCDDVATIEATYYEWYESIEQQLSALAGAVMMTDGSLMLHGQFCRWEGDGTNLTQRIDDLDTYIERELTRRNDGYRAPVSAANDEAARLFG